ncbi:MAG TPA: signal peptidase I [Nitrosarchaeum sp.]|nr:signal peptidase I [Nitrosarchaeum sp.]
MMLNKKSISKGILKDIIIVAIGVIAIWVGLQVAFGTQNPFYVVASGSMIPVLQVYDVLIVQGHEPFEDIQVGDIIVFNRPSGHDRVIVHRVAAIIDDEPKTIRTKGDANPASIPGTDFPITKEEYIGKVAYVIPQVGYVTQLLKPPINYIIIVIVIGIMVVKQMSKKKSEKELSLQDPFIQKESGVESSVSIPELDKLKKDNEYSKHESKFSKESEESEKDQK